MKYFTLPKQSLEKFTEILRESFKIVAPVKKENQFAFSEYDSFKEVTLEHIPTVLPPKKYFLPQYEQLLKFSMGTVTADSEVTEKEPTVMLGVHTCDIAGIACLGSIFHKEPYDCYYSYREKAIKIIGYECMKPCDDKATCVTMDTLIPRGFYDIMITDSGDNYIFDVNSMTLLNIVLKSGLFTEGAGLKAKLVALREAKMKKFDVKLKASYSELYKVFDKSYKSNIWAEDVGKRCLSCGNCTAVCPTCYCFDINDGVDMKLLEGSRMRVWDSCQLNDFAVVAGGENFRKTRSARQRHRFYRKFSHSVPKYNKYFCVGCGRCTRACMAQISLIDTVNGLTEAVNKEK